MTEEQVEKLQDGDEVFWNDPDDSLTSGHIIIQSIKVIGEVVAISSEDGDYIECYAEELS